MNTEMKRPRTKTDAFSKKSVIKKKKMGRPDTVRVLAVKVKSKANVIHAKKKIKRWSKPIRQNNAVTSTGSYDDAIDAVVRNAVLDSVLDSVARNESEKQNNSAENLEMRLKTLPKGSKRTRKVLQKKPKSPNSPINVSSGKKRKATSRSLASDLCSPEKSPKLNKSPTFDISFPLRRRKLNELPNSDQGDTNPQNISPGCENSASSLMECRRSLKQQRPSRKEHDVEISNKGKTALNEIKTSVPKMSGTVGLQKTANALGSSKVRKRYSFLTETYVCQKTVQSKTPSSASVAKLAIVTNTKKSEKRSRNRNPSKKIVMTKEMDSTVHVLDSKQKVETKCASQDVSGNELHVNAVNKHNKLKHKRKHKSKDEQHKENLEVSALNTNKITEGKVKKDNLSRTSTRSSPVTSQKVKSVKSSKDKRQKQNVPELLSNVHKNIADNLSTSDTDNTEGRKTKKTLYSPLRLKKDDDVGVYIESDTESDDNVLYSLSHNEIDSSHLTHEHVSQKLSEEDKSLCTSGSNLESSVKDKGQVASISGKKSNRSPSVIVVEPSVRSKGKKVGQTNSLTPTTSTEPVKPVPILPTSSSQPPMENGQLGGDIVAYEYVVQPSPVMPISPASMSYQVLMENLPHQLHPRRKNGKPAATHREEEVERRVSVRSSECAFKYKEILIKKCHKYTQIWLHTRTQMRNALNPQVIQEIVSALNAAKYDDSNLVMFSGLGNMFCSGIDLHFLTTGDKKVAARQMSDALRDFTKTFITFPKLIVAVVTGPAMGLGMTMLPLCDVVYASDKATFHLPYSQLSQTPEGCASYTLPHCIGIAMANELLFGGRKITAIEACQLGLISQVYWPTSMMQEVIPRIQNMALQSGKVLETTKLLVRSHQRTKLDLTNESETNLLLERWPTTECQKAITDYLSNEKNCYF